METVARAPEWSPLTHEDYRRLTDKDVYSDDGEKIGRVVSVLHPEGEPATVIGDHCLAVMPTVMRNLFGADVAYVPETAIREVDTDKVVLTVPSDCLADQGGASRPAGTECVSCS
jgi:hypothetical protein